MTDEKRWVGTWSLPGDNREIGGVLTLDDDGSSTLELAGSLIPWHRKNGMTDVDDISQFPLVHGKACGRQITLLRSWTGQSQTSFSQYVTEVQVLKPQAVIVGLHLDDPDEAFFDGIEVEIDNLTAWTAATGINRTMSRDDEGAATWTTRITQPDALVTRTSSGNFRIGWRSNIPGAGRYLDRTEVGVSETAVLRIELDGKRSWYGFAEAERAWQDLLTFASRHPCSVRRRTLFIHSDESTGLHPLPLTCRKMDGGTATSKNDGGKFLFLLNDVDLLPLLGRWFELRGRLGLGLHVLFGLDYQPKGYLENRLLNAGAAVEAFHKALFPDAAGPDREIRARALHLVQQSNADRALKSWIKQQLRNFPVYKQRAGELASRADPEAVSRLLGDGEVWVKWLAAARNAVAHLSETELARVPSDARHSLASVIVALLHLVLLQELGLPAELQRRVVEEVYWYPAEQFRAQVAGVPVVMAQKITKFA